MVRCGLIRYKSKENSTHKQAFCELFCEEPRKPNGSAKSNEPKFTTPQCAK